MNKLYLIPLFGILFFYLANEFALFGIKVTSQATFCDGKNSFYRTIYNPFDTTVYYHIYDYTNSCPSGTTFRYKVEGSSEYVNRIEYCRLDAPNHIVCKINGKIPMGAVNIYFYFYPPKEEITPPTAQPTEQVTGRADIRIVSSSFPDKEYYPGEEVPITIRVKNYGEKTGTINMEACVFPEKWRGIAFSLLRPLSYYEIPSCCPQNEFCEAVKITLAPGEEQTITLNPKIPTRDSRDHCNNLGSAWDSKFNVVVGTYEYCGGGYKSVQIKPINVNIQAVPLFKIEVVDIVFVGMLLAVLAGGLKWAGII